MNTCVHTCVDERACIQKVSLCKKVSASNGNGFLLVKELDLQQVSQVKERNPLPFLIISHCIVTVTPFIQAAVHHTLLGCLLWLDYVGAKQKLD